MATFLKTKAAGYLQTIGFLLALCIISTLSSCDQINYDTIEELAEEGDIAGLQDIVVNSEIEGYLRLNAASTIADLVKDNAEKYDQQEAVFEAFRNDARGNDPSTAYYFEFALSSMNEREISDANTQFLTNAQIMIDDYKAKGVTKALVEGNAVDAIIANERVLEMSPFHGLTRSEIDTHVEQISLVGVILRHDVWVGYYDCGEAQQIIYDMYLIDLRDETVKSSKTIDGGMPPKTFKTIMNTRCDRTGSKPDYKPYFEVRAFE